MDQGREWLSEGHLVDQWQRGLLIPSPAFGRYDTLRTACQTKAGERTHHPSFQEEERLCNFFLVQIGCVQIAQSLIAHSVSRPWCSAARGCVLGLVW